MKTPLVLYLFVTAFRVSVAAFRVSHASKIDTQPEPCTVRARKISRQTTSPAVRSGLGPARQPPFNKNTLQENSASRFREQNV